LNSVQVAAQSFAGKVSVVDSGSLSMGTGWQIIEAAEAIIKGYTVDRVLDCIEAIKRKVRVFAMLDTLEFVRRSGRVSWARASIGAMLSIKPFVELKEGVVLSYGQVRTWRKGFDYLLNIYRSLLPVRRLAVLHTNAEAEANQFIDALDLEGAARPLVINVTSAIGTHVGPHGLGFAVVQE
jgi:DegV family protein with EDD domain